MIGKNRTNASPSALHTGILDSCEEIIHVVRMAPRLRFRVG
jgi:hypothetical protein